jgi:hypothetical protein
MSAAFVAAVLLGAVWEEAASAMGVSFDPVFVVAPTTGVDNARVCSRSERRKRGRPPAAALVVLFCQFFKRSATGIGAEIVQLSTTFGLPASVSTIR